MAFIHEGVPTFVGRKSPLLCEDYPDVVAIECPYSSASGLVLHNEFHVFLAAMPVRRTLCVLTGPKSYLTHFTVDTVNTGVISWTHCSRKTLELLIQTAVV